MEYFYAKHVVDQHDTIKDLFKTVRSHIAKKERDVVNHLSVQIKTNGNDRLQQQALDEIIAYRRKLSKAESVYTVLQFLAKSLEYLVPSEAAVRVVVEELYEFSAHGGDKIDTGLVSLALQSCNLARDFLEGEVVRLVSADLLGDDVARAERALHYLILAGRSRWSVNSNDNYLPVSAIVDQTRDHIIKLADEKPLWAHAAWSLLAAIRPEWLHRYGLQSYAQTELVTGFEYISSLDSVVRGLHVHYKERYQRGTISGNALRVALATWGDVGFALAESGPVSLMRPSHHIQMPLDIWVSALEGFLDKPELFKGAYFLWESVREFRPLLQIAEFEREVERIRGLAHRFLRRHEQWSGLNDSFRAALREERPTFVGGKLDH